jgi:hypothetical protein
VEFRGAAAIRVAAHKAVLLKMNNEQRASLWSDGRHSYVLLFNGTDQELHAYMTKMGIIA